MLLNLYFQVKVKIFTSSMPKNSTYLEYINREFDDETNEFLKILNKNKNLRL